MREPARTFEEWWADYGSKYQAAVLEAGGAPYTDDLDERRRLWERRHTRPTPPVGLTNNLREIRE